MTEDETKRTEAAQKASQYRERAATYESLSEEAQRRGDTQMSIEFARKAAEEQAEASRIEAEIAADK